VVNQEISPNDRLYAANPKGYARHGALAVQHLRRALELGGRDGAASILDLPCGHGRVLRALKGAFPEARLWACDIDRDGVDFCAATFGARPIYSAERPDDVVLPVVDLIWSGSFYTHLPRDAYSGFLALMRRSLGLDGLLVFTIYSSTELKSSGLEPDQATQIVADFRREGFGFQPYRVGYDGFGTWGAALSSRSYVQQEAARAGLEVLSHETSAWCRQDVVVCRPL
jgi:hypothetical protein